LLNELAELSRSLEERGIQTQAWHPWIKVFKKAEAIVAELDETGSLSRVSMLSIGEVSLLRNIAPDFHNSFPGLNLNCPVLAVPDASFWNQPEALWNAALTVTLASPLAYESGDIRRLSRLLHDFPVKEIAPRLRGDGPKLLATVAILKRLALAAKPDADAFLHHLVLKIVAAVQAGRLSQPLALAILYGKPNKKKTRLEEWKTTLIFDVNDIDHFPYRVADAAVAAEWSRVLLASDETSPGEERFLCSLTGRPDTLLDDKMPSPTLKVLGSTILMSMNRDTPCQTRYGKTSTAIFRVGKNSVQSANDSLLFVTEPERRGKTWTGVPNGSNERGDLLLAYLEEDPDADVPLTGFFADMETDEAQELATYEMRTARLYDALRLREKPGTDFHIKVIVLTKIDPGRAQVLFSARYSVAAIYSGRDRWLAGADNVPKIAVPFPSGKGKPAVWRFGYQPSPTEVMASFKRQWLRAGHTNQGVPGVDLGMVYALLLEPEATRQAAWLLDRYLGLTEPLLIGLARSLAGGASLPETARKEALIAVAAYGILLLRQGRERGNYMESRDYLLGQFLQLADLLHKLYCVHERKGSIPPQLVGNAAIPMALQSPRRAIQVLGNRMPVYIAWADRYQGEGAGLAKWSRRELGRLSSQLKDENLDAKVTANGKAELLLGYLATTRQSEKQESSL
jgi:hypothetical protein